MDYRVIPRHISPQFRAALLGIVWRLIVPVLVVLVVAEALSWWQQAAASAAVATPATARPSASYVSGWGEVLERAVVVGFFWVFCLLSWVSLVIVQALLSPLPFHQRYLHGRPWVYALLGAGAFVGCAYLFQFADWLVNSTPTWVLLGGGVLGLALPGLIEWLAKPAAIEPGAAAQR